VPSLVVGASCLRGDAYTAASMVMAFPCAIGRSPSSTPRPGLRTERHNLVIKRYGGPPLADKLADLMARVAANDAVIDHTKRKGLPEDAAGLFGTELVARGLQSFSAGGSFVPR
jgi:hypothetical protein